MELLIWGFFLGSLLSWLIISLIFIIYLREPRPEMRYFVNLANKAKISAKCNDPEINKGFETTKLTEVSFWRYWLYNLIRR